MLLVTNLQSDEWACWDTCRCAKKIEFSPSLITFEVQLLPMTFIDLVH